MKTIILISLLLIGCSAQDDDPKPAFPVPSLLGTWKLAFETTTNCAQAGTFTGTSNQKLFLTESKLANGNYSATYQGASIEYQLKGDSIIFPNWKRGTYALTNVLIINGKLTTNGCTFKDQFQR